MSKAGYFFKDGVEIIGPLTATEVRRLISDGVLLPNAELFDQHGAVLSAQDLQPCGAVDAPASQTPRATAPAPSLPDTGESHRDVRHGEDTRPEESRRSQETQLLSMTHWRRIAHVLSVAITMAIVAVVVWILVALNPSVLTRSGAGPPLALLLIGAAFHFWRPAIYRALLRWGQSRSPGRMGTPHMNAFRCVTVSPKGDVAASIDDDLFLRIWDLRSDEETDTLPSHDSMLRAVVFSPDGRYLITSGTTISVYEAKTLKRLWRRPGNKLVWAMTVAPDSDGFIWADHDGRVTMESLTLSWERCEVRPSHASVVGIGFLTAWNGPLIVYDDGRVYGVKFGETDRKPRAVARGPAGILNVAFSANGKRFVCTTAGTVSVFGVRQGKLAVVAEHSAVRTGCVALSTDGTRVLTASLDHVIHLWKVETSSDDPSCKPGQLVELQAFSGHTEEITGLAFSPDGRFAVSASADRTIRRWDLQS